MRTDKYGWLKEYDDGPSFGNFHLNLIVLAEIIGICVSICLLIRILSQ